MIDFERPKYADLLEELYTIYDVDPRPGRSELYWRDLKAFSFSVVEQAARDLRTTSPRFPGLSDWIARCKAIAAQRARASHPTPVATDEPAAASTWTAVANVILIHARLAGARFDLADAADRRRALELIHAELFVLREEYSSPSAVPREHYAREKARIVGVLRAARAADQEQPA